MSALDALGAEGPRSGALAGAGLACWNRATNTVRALELDPGLGLPLADEWHAR